MRKVIIIGAGKIGSTIVKMLNRTGGDYEIEVADSNVEALNSLSYLQIKTTLATYIADDIDKTAALLKGHDAVISAASFSANMNIAAAATVAGVSYFDLTEDVGVTDFIFNICMGRSSYLTPRPGQIFMPQCGLAPGFVGISAGNLIKQFDEVETVKMRVGALPRFPTNDLKYNLTWSTDGLINEYCNPCHCIVDGSSTDRPALADLEHFAIDGVEYEAFNTSGGLGTLCDTLSGKVEFMDYKTIRYPGHRDLMDFLLNGLGFRFRRDELKKLFDEMLPLTKQDVVLIFNSVIGMKNGRKQQISDVRQVYGRDDMSAIQLTTASGICACVDLFFEGKLPTTGFIHQEDIKYDEFIQNRFGSAYDYSAGRRCSLV